MAKKAKQIKEDLELDDHHIAGLATIALYDIVFLCGWSTNTYFLRG